MTSLRDQEPSELHRSVWLKLTDVVTVAVCSLAFSASVVGICVLFITGNHPGGRDVVSYWAAGKQALQHANPYDVSAVLRTERAAGFPADDQALVMRNPPTALPLVLPLGLFTLRTAALLWSGLLVASFIVSVQLLWMICGRQRNKLHLLLYTFGPALTCLFAGQTGMITLLGLVLFLRFHRTQPYFAGAALWLCALKPHLFIPFGVVLLVWLVLNRAYKVMAAFVATLIAGSLIATHLDPGIWRQYLQLIRSTSIQNEFVPCVSVAFANAFGAHAMWVRYVPSGLGAVWGLAYFWKNRADWDWLTHGSLLLLVSIAVSPYAWLSDQALVMPAMLLGMYRAKSFGALQVFALASAAIEIELLARISLHSPLFLWTAPFWLCWYLYVGRGHSVEAGAYFVGVDQEAA